MEQISGENHWRLVLRRETAGITILWAATCDAQATLPDTLLGLPVTALGGHALTPGRPMPEGEEVVVTCGPDGGREWDNRALTDLTLPETLERVGDYAFFNCACLRTLRLRDTVRYWGGGLLMNCRALDTFHITCTVAEGELMAYFAGELSRELDMTLFRRDGQTARLIFPEYVEVYEENCPAHHFDYNIYGAGYGYHHCFYQKKLNFKTYDELWRPMLAMEHNDDCALRLAWWRLRYPVELSPQAEAAYWDYLRAHAPETGRWLLDRRDTEGLGVLLRRTDWSREDLAALCEGARKEEAPAALALLLEEQHRRFPSGMDKCFDL